jgi:DNA polymerase-3 subunit delta
MARQSPKPPTVVVIYGEDEYRKAGALRETLGELLPPDVDRSLALVEYDGAAPEEQGGPTLAAVMDDLSTLPFLSDRRVVLVRDADSFISEHRERLETYVASAPGTSTLILVCRSFPRNTRLYKAAAKAGGRLIECKKLSGRGLVDFAIERAEALGKQIAPQAAAYLVQRVGDEPGVIAAETEKLALYTAERERIERNDITELVGLSREEKIFAVMDAAGVGRLTEALRLWQQVVVTDPAVRFRVVGGIAFVLRRWLTAHQMRRDGAAIRTIAPRVMMWGRERELESLLDRLPQSRIQFVLARLAELDSEVKVGARSIETGVEAILTDLAAPAA